MQKVAIFGLSGAGKSTFASWLSQYTTIPVYYLDTYYWKSGWVEQEPKEFKRIHAELIVHDTWILEGNCMVTFKERIQAADTLIYFDFPRFFCLWRIVKRRLMYTHRERADRPKECPEQLSWKLIQYVLWRFKQRYRPLIGELLRRAPEEGKTVYTVKNVHQLRALQQKLAAL
jgi:adenylate kinase family enzyme